MVSRVVGILWIIGIALKILGIISTGWISVLLWPCMVFFLVMVVVLLGFVGLIVVSGR